MTHDHPIIERTRTWMADFVIGLNLCPFAARPFQAGKIRFVLSEATEVEGLLKALAEELQGLHKADSDSVETSILIHPFVLQEFEAYNDFLDIADLLLAEMKLEGELQIVSFHPQYQFADAEPDAVENYTNRSPYPMLHLLREASVERAVNSHPDVNEIPKRNVKLLRNMGPEEVKKYYT